MNTSGENPSNNMLEFHGFNYNQEETHHHQQIPISSSPPILSWPIPPTPPIFNPSLPPLPPPSLHPFYGDLYARTRASASLQFAYNDFNLDPLGLSSFYNYMNSSSSSSLPFGSLHGEIGKMSAQEIMDAKALAASKSHSEAERRRRERINAHLAKLRSLLPSTTKTDKASLLAEVIQHVKELKRQTSEIAVESPLPTESDELTIDTTNVDDDGRFIVKASLCCDDRSDLLPELIKALKALRLRTLKAEITTVGGRVKNVLVITGDENFDHNQQVIASIQEALKAVMERTGASDEQAPSAVGGIKRQRTSTSLSTILEHNSI